MIMYKKYSDIYLSTVITVTKYDNESCFGFEHKILFY